ncbi:MAG: hypothetical protein HFI05_05630 [Lachnospiraceae bacterium]|mgnify:CR=1 FL=1|jgi:hypothetical protein|nr:hypothetical protein [Lachnospiraceae bacterium]
MRKIRNINQTVWELIIGIVLVNALLEVIGLIFVSQKGAYTIGLVLGMLMAIGMVFHMNISIEKAMDIGGEHAKGYMLKSYAIRTVVVLAVIVCVGVLKFANLLSLLLGIMTLKVAAYLQPITHRFMESRKAGNKRMADENLSSENKE